MPFLKIGDCVHHYVAEGPADRPALVFSNSLGSDLRIWDALAPHLASEFRIIRYDIRGHGLSDVPPPPYTIDELTGDLVALLDFLEIKETMVCGLSVGGLIAQRFTLSSPERVRALVLCDTGARIGSIASWDERIATVKESGLSKLVGPSMERWFSQAFRDRRIAEVRGYANMLRRIPAEGYLGTCYALREADLSAAVSTISKPTLVLCGDQDIATPPELGRELARAIPHAQFSLIEQAAHITCVEQPEAMAQQMTQFFREVQIV